MSKATSKELDLLHGLLAREMAKKIQKGEATAADWSVIRAFLRDNRIEGLNVPGAPLNDLTKTLPYPGSNDDDEYVSH